MGQVEPPSLSTFDFFLFPPTSSFSFSYLKSFDMEISSRETSLFFLFAAVDVITHNRLRCVECSSFLRRPFPPPSPTTTTSLQKRTSKCSTFQVAVLRRQGAQNPLARNSKWIFFSLFVPPFSRNRSSDPRSFLQAQLRQSYRNHSRTLSAVTSTAIASLNQELPFQQIGLHPQHQRRWWRTIPFSAPPLSRGENHLRLTPAEIRVIKCRSVDRVQCSTNSCGLERVVGRPQRKLCPHRMMSPHISVIITNRVHLPVGVLQPVY